MARNEDGFAALESIVSGFVFFTFVAAILLAAYFQFGQAWIQYRSEQALYCLAENEREHLCKRDLKAKLEKFLPWGSWNIRLERQSKRWQVDIRWEYKNYALEFKKELNPELLITRKASLW